MQVRLRPRQLDPAARKLERRLEQARPGQRAVRAVRRLEAGRRARNRAGRRADPEDLGGVAVEVDVDRLHVGRPRPARAEAGDGDEEVEQPVAPVARPVDEHEAARSRARERALGDPGGECGGDAGIDGVAALGEDPGARLGGQRVPGCDRALHRCS